MKDFFYCVFLFKILFVKSRTKKKKNAFIIWVTAYYYDLIKCINALEQLILLTIQIQILLFELNLPPVHPKRGTVEVCMHI